MLLHLTQLNLGQTPMWPSKSLKDRQMKNQELSKVEDYELVEKINEQIHGHEVHGNQKHTKLVIYMGCQQNTII